MKKTKYLFALLILALSLVIITKTRAQETMMITFRSAPAGLAPGTPRSDPEIIQIDGIPFSSPIPSIVTYNFGPNAHPPCGGPPVPGTSPLSLFSTHLYEAQYMDTKSKNTLHIVFEQI
jgi:hypothetical protein